MSVSSHLTPEPERRLWIILENMRDAVDRAERRLAVVTALAAVEVLLSASGGAARWLALIPLGLALPLGVFGLSALSTAPNWLPFLQFPHAAQLSGDCLVLYKDIAKYTQLELIHSYDRYLGGGISDTRYYEDIVGQIVGTARVAARKDLIFRALCVLAGLGQLGLLAALAAR